MICPICGNVPSHALMGPFPVWYCECPGEPYPCVGGFWAPVASVLADHFHNGFHFLVSPHTGPLWYPRALWFLLTGRE